jgi:hypothetical protein
MITGLFIFATIGFLVVLLILIATVGSFIDSLRTCIRCNKPINMYEDESKDKIQLMQELNFVRNEMNYFKREKEKLEKSLSDSVLEAIECTK